MRCDYCADYGCDYCRPKRKPPVDSMGMDDLPNVAGRMQCSLLEFERRCRLYIQAEAERVNTDMTLYSIICDAVRLSREYTRSKEISVCAVAGGVVGVDTAAPVAATNP